MSPIRILLILLLALTINTRAQVSVVTTGINSPFAPSASGNGNSQAPSLSADGRYVVFCSSAKDLTPTRINQFLDVFVRDLDTGATKLISIDPGSSSSGNGDSSYPVISSTGQYIGFITMASNLTTQTGGTYPQLLLRDTVANSTELVSVDTSGNPATNGYVTDTDITPDGRYVLFVSSHQNLTPETNATAALNLYLRDRIAQTTTLITYQITNTSMRSFGSVDSPSISTNGQIAVYTSLARDLVVLPTNAPTNIHAYLFDRVANTNSCLSLDAQQVIGAIPNASSNVTVSADGSAIAFMAVSNAPYLIYETVATRQPLVVTTNIDLSTPPQLSSNGRFLLFRGANNGATNVYLWNAQNLATQTINITTNGTVNGDSIPAAMSADGSRIVFISNATNLTAAATNGLYQIYIRDLNTSVTRLISMTPTGPAPTSQRHSYPTISADGSRVAFTSADNFFVPNDNNQSIDVFVWSWNSGQVQLASARDTSLISDTDVAGVMPSAFSVSSNAQFIAYAAVDSVAVPNDTNNYIDVFVRNTSSAQTFLASTSATGNFATNGPATAPAISADGRYVAYLRNAGTATTDFGDIYLRDMQAPGPALISTNTSGVAIGNATRHSISADGRFIAYQTTSAVRTTDSNGKMDIYIYDSSTRTNALVSYPGAGLSTAYDSSNAVFSPNGNWLVFQSASPYMSGANLNSTTVQLYGRQPTTGSNFHLSYITAGTAYAGNCGNPVFSANSQFMAFTSSSNGVPLIALHNFSNDVNQTLCYNGASPSLNADGSKLAYTAQQGGFTQIFLKNIGSTQSNLVSVSTNGISPANAACLSPVLTPDGRFVIFSSYASNLVPGDTNALMDVFIRDLVLSNTIALGSQNGSIANFGTVNPVIAADGRTIVFQSFSPGLTANNFTANRNLFTAHILVGDSDHDGMDDDWEMTYFGDLSHDGTADTDGDGLTDLQEFQAGTNPINNTSVLRCLAISTSNGTTIYWSSVPGQDYQVEFKDDLNSQTWGSFHAITATNETTSLVDPNTTLSTQRFYRVVKATPPPPPPPPF
jgi:Tol biopolymer transport system component